MFHLMTPRTTTAQRRARRFGRLVAQAVRSVVNPAALVKAEPTTTEPVAAPVTEPADLYTPDEMPALADIERAALGYDLACDAARSADRNKRKHRKVLSRLGSGRYGAWIVERKPSTRMTPDLAEIERLFREHNLGAVPMRPVAPSLVVKPAPVEVTEVASDEQARELVTA